MIRTCASWIFNCLNTFWYLNDLPWSLASWQSDCPRPTSQLLKRKVFDRVCLTWTDPGVYIVGGQLNKTRSQVGRLIWICYDLGFPIEVGFSHWVFPLKVPGTNKLIKWHVTSLSMCRSRWPASRRTFLFQLFGKVFLCHVTCVIDSLTINQIGTKLYFSKLQIGPSEQLEQVVKKPIVKICRRRVSVDPCSLRNRLHRGNWTDSSGSRYLNRCRNLCTNICMPSRN